MLPPAVEDVVDRYLRAVDALAPGVIEAVYLTGSVAMNDFRPGSSDVDFIAITGEPIHAAREALRAAHARVRAGRRGPFFDGMYLRWDDLKRDPGDVLAGAVVHEGRWRDDTIGVANPVAWHELAWHGVAARGPDRRDLAVWTDPQALVRWTRRNMRDYWRWWHSRACRPLSVLGVAMLGPWAPAWGVLGVARQRYTLATGRLTSKTGAGEWARDVFGERWWPILDECVRLRTGTAPRGYYYARPLARRRDALGFMDEAMIEVLA